MNLKLFFGRLFGVRAAPNANKRPRNPKASLECLDQLVEKLGKESVDTEQIWSSHGTVTSQSGGQFHLSSQVVGILKATSQTLSEEVISFTLYFDDEIGPLLRDLEPWLDAPLPIPPPSPPDPCTHYFQIRTRNALPTKLRARIQTKQLPTATRLQPVLRITLTKGPSHTSD